MEGGAIVLFHHAILSIQTTLTDEVLSICTHQKYHWRESTSRIETSICNMSNM